MRIVKPGRPTVVLYRGTCPKCGCVVETPQSGVTCPMPFCQFLFWAEECRVVVDDEVPWWD